MTVDEDEEDMDVGIAGDRLVPFLKWAGGKREQAEAIAAWCTARLGPGGRYIEPCLGGGAVALAMPRGTPMILGDANEALGYLWWWIQQRPAAIAEIAAGLGAVKGEGCNTETGYYDVRRAFNTCKLDAEDPTPSARFLWLVHACFNALYRENSLGGFNVPWGKRARVVLPDAAALIAISEHLQTAQIYPGWDFADLIAMAQPGDVVYVDPPYDADLTAFTTYVAKAFDPREQERLADVIWAAIGRGVAVMTSNADTERVRKLYNGLTVETIEEPRSIAARADKRKSAPCVRISTR